jgi:hypothetical protein
MTLKIVFIVFLSIVFNFKASAQWEKQNSGTVENLHSVYCINKDTCWAVGDNNTVLKTCDGGNTWIPYTFPDLDSTQEWLCVQFINKTGWIASTPTSPEKILLRSDDMGENWTVYDFSGIRYTEEMIFIDEDFGLVNQYKTIDGGKTWERLNLNTVHYAVHCDFALNENLIWLGCLQGEILNTIDGGNSWREIKLDGYSPIIHFINENNGWALASDKLYKTSNSGQDWQLIYTHGDPHLGMIKFVNEKFGCMAGFRYNLITSKSYGQLYITNNGGETWVPQITQTISGICSICFVDSAFGLAVGYDGTILKWDTGTTSIKDNTNRVGHLPSKFILYQNYPNPFNPSTTIKYYLYKSSNVQLSIYNLSGQKIEILVDEFQTSGEHKIYWQPKGLSSGIYFYKYQADEFTETKKLILLK